MTAPRIAPTAAAARSVEPPISQRALRGGPGLLLGLLGLALAWQALRKVAWTEVFDLVAGISPSAILILVAINLLLVPVMTARWWLLLGTLGWPVGLRSLCGYRIAASAVSSLTPGPHCGGEPLSIYLLHRRHGIPLTAATTSVLVDRLLELVASLVVLTLCLTGSGTPLFTGNGRSVVILLGSAVSLLFLSTLCTGRHPLSRAVLLLGKGLGKHVPALFGRTGSLAETIAQSEAMAAALYREHRYLMLLASFIFLGHWLAVFLEFWLMGYFLGCSWSFWQLSAVVAVARLAFFTPLPAGIGVLETALPWVTASLGLGIIPGVGLCLLIRARDLVFGLAGLGLTMKYLTCRSKAGIISDTEGPPSAGDLLK